MPHHPSKYPFLVFILLFFGFFQSSNATDLSNIQTQITQNKSKTVEQIKRQKELELQVESAEKKEADAALTLQKTGKRLQSEELNLEALKEESLELNREIKKQTELLEDQLVSAYMTGQNDLLKLVFKQEDISKIIRMKSYYQYLNDARINNIKALETMGIRIEENKTQQTQSIERLKTLHLEQSETQAILLAERNKRGKSLRELNQDLNYQNAKLIQLNDQEDKLKKKLKKKLEEQKIKYQAELKELRRKKAENKRKHQAQLDALREQKAEQVAPPQIVKIPTSERGETRKQAAYEKQKTSLRNQKGKFNWPIKGRIFSSFGSKRSSQVKWKGIIIDANEGEKVKSIAAGKVLFAGYFKGYGMLIALDHSDNYITLYGYNQTLLFETGDIVLKNETIAQAGNSGGQSRNSLYFEISHKGRAEDPINWLRKR